MGKVAKLVGFEASLPTDEMGERKGVIPAERVHYLSEIAATVRDIIRQMMRLAKSYVCVSISKLPLIMPLNEALKQWLKTSKSKSMSYSKRLVKPVKH